jgi:hypothetical protein
VVAIPFATNGRVGILGQGLVNDDWASHLLFAEWADTREGPTPDLVEDGYPLGPHAIVAAAVKVTGADFIEGFAGLTGAVAVLLALTAYGALRGVRDRWRAPAAVLGAMTYLAAAYLAQGAFKEPMLGLSLLGFTLALSPLLRPWDGLQPTLVSTLPDRGRGWVKSQAGAALPAGVIAAGVIYNYSFPGLAWLALAAIAWGLMIAWRERKEREGLELRNRLRWARPALVVLIGVPVLAALPEVVNFVHFLSFEAFNPQGTGPRVGFGNLRQPLNPLEVLGIWPSSEFRITPSNATTPAIAFYLGGLLALIAFAWGVGRALARRELALPSALIAGGLAYLAALALGTPYTQAKSLAILAPAVMVLILRGLLSAEALEQEEEREAKWWPPRRIRPFVRLGIPLLAAAFVLSAAFSTLLPLRQSAVGPGYHVGELERMRPLVDGQEVLFLGRDNFISWELIGSEVFAPIINHYDTEEVPSLYRATTINAKFDWDNVPDEVLGDFDWVITTSADFASEAPPEFEPRLESDDFVLWERRDGAETPGPGEPGARRTLLEPLYPGAGVECGEPGDAKLTGVAGKASVSPVTPVLGRSWEPRAELTDARGASQELRLTPGAWEISIQYASSQAMHIRAPGLDTTMRANLLFRGPSPYYPAGVLEVPRHGRPLAPRPVRFGVTVDDPPLAGRLLGTESRAYLGTLAATPISDPHAKSGAPAHLPAASRIRVPLRSACGSYIDWYRLAPGTPPSAVAGVEAPVTHPPEDE